MADETKHHYREIRNGTGVTVACSCGWQDSDPTPSFDDESNRWLWKSHVRSSFLTIVL